MLVPLSWLREFVPYQGTAQELGDRLTMLGLELEGITNPFAGLEAIVVGHVVECGKHPEADKLSVCRVDVGSEVLDIVCGAPNVRQGLKVAVVTVGTTLPNGLTIKKAKLRGAPSGGMICSEAELGLSDEHDGIMELPQHLTPGQLFIEAMGLDTEVLDISITPNRGDCLSILGIARETALAFSLPLTLPEAKLVESDQPAADAVSIHIEAPDLCPMYAARVLENAPSAQSPSWLRYRLHAAGVRAISNHVDVTNYIMLELGQPLHAFDLETVRGAAIHVRGADQDEQFTTLDNKTHTLNPADITIRDAERIVALGGVMGGLNSEITGKSSRVLLECARFNPSHIRRTARRLAQHSEASYRFERGVDQLNADYVLNRAASLMAELSGGTVRKGIVKAEPKPWQAPAITLRRQRAVDLLGVDMPTAFCEGTLTTLGCRLQAGPVAQTTCPETWLVTHPSHRHDLACEADLIEELVRVYGVDNIPPVLPGIIKPLEDTGKPEPAHAFRSRMKHWACGLGLNEAVNYSFVSHKELDFLGQPAEGRISIMNPLSDEQNVLRTHLAAGLLQNLRTNIAQGAHGVRLFEVATSFVAAPQTETTAQESTRLALLLYGNRFDGAWPQTQAEHDYQDMKGIVEHLARHLHLPALSWKQEAVAPWLAPGVGIYAGETCIGYAGRVKPGLADDFHAKKPVWLAELFLDVLYEMHLAQRIRFAPMPTFPAVRRDITFICPHSLEVGAVLACIRSQKLPLLADVKLIDLFEPKGGEERNLTFRLTFRHKEKTLQDVEVDKMRDTAVNGVCKELNVRV